MTNTDLMNVSAFENQLPDAAFSTLNPADDSLADGIGQSYGVIGYKGKVWTLRYRGETYTFTRPDDGSPAAFLDVIVLRSANFKSKSFYEDGFQDGASTGKRPTCSSLDGVVPDNDVLKKMSEACAICSKNEFKTAANGRKGKDCSDYKRLAVLILPSQSARLFGGQALMEPVFLRVPAASLNDLATLGEAMSRKGFHYATYITRIGFDVEKPHPQMTFRALQKLTAQEAPIVIKLREDPQAYRITGENEVGKTKTTTGVSSAAIAAGTSTGGPAAHGGVTNQVHTQPVSKPQDVQAQAQPQVNNANDEIAQLRARLAAAEAAAKGGPAPAPAPAGGVSVHQQESEAVDTGFGAGVTVIPPAKSNGGGAFGMDVGLGASQPVVEVAQGTSPLAPQPTSAEADTGPADESDDDLDARVAGLLQR